MIPAELIPIAIFFAVTGLLIFLTTWNGSSDRVDERLEELQGKQPIQRRVRERSTRETPKALANLSTLLSKDKVAGERARELLHHAGYYHPQAIQIYLGMKVLMAFAPWLVSGALWLSGSLPWKAALLCGAGGAALGMLAPTFWLESRRKKRQAKIRRAIPDLLDVLIVCMEGGLSLSAALEEVIEEFRAAHPILGSELNIIQWETRFGETVGIAFENFAKRCGVDEIRAIAGCFKQNERYGSGLLDTLRSLSEMLRFKQIQHTEELAQKAGTRILFPTLLFIFPGVFVILLGPAAIQVKDLMGSMKKSAPSKKQSAQ